MSSNAIDIDTGVEVYPEVKSHVKNLQQDVEDLHRKVDRILADRLTLTDAFELLRTTIDQRVVELLKRHNVDLRMEGGELHHVNILLEGDVASAEACSSMLTGNGGDWEEQERTSSMQIMQIVPSRPTKQGTVDVEERQASKTAYQKSVAKVISQTQGNFSYSAEEYEQAKESWILQAQMYEFTESVWDASMFIYIDFLRSVDSFLMLVMFLVNLCMQFCLTLFSLRPFTQPAFEEDDINNLREWRTVVAHDFRWMDSITEQSLARLVCSSPQAPYLSGSTKVTKDVLLAYSPDPYYGSQESIFHASFMGEALCLLVLVIWWLTCYTEFRGWFHCMQAVALVPSGGHSYFFLMKPPDIDDIGVQRMARFRKVWCVFVLCLRLAIACILAYMGTLFLIYTTSLRELILNAVALELMLNVDELIYASMAPFKLRHFISCLEPVPKYNFFSCNIDSDTPVVVVFLCFAMFLATPILDDQADLMSRAVHEICGGYLDFVFSLDPGGALVAHSTPMREDAYPRSLGPSGSQDVILDQTKTYRWRAVRELIEDPASVARNPTESLTDGASTLSGSALGLVERPSIVIGHRMQELNPACADWSLSGDSSLVWPVDFISKLYPSHPVFGEGKTCQEGFQYCNWDNEIGIAMRQWCAQTCGCDGANTSLILAKQTSGCPSSCLELPYYQATLKETPCVDQVPSSKVFQDYLRGMRSLRESYIRIGAWYDMFGSWIDNLEKNGCSGFQLTNGNANLGTLCGSTAFGLKPFVNICPQTCKCNANFKVPRDFPPLCPETC